jgi:hypothetical protein
MKAGVGLITAALLCAGPALAADKGVAVPPPPRSVEFKDVQAWIDRYVKADGWYLSAAYAGGALLISPDTLEVTKKGTIKFWYRTELFAPEYIEGKIIRSYTSLVEIDCSDERRRYLAGDAFPQNSLGGEAVESTNDAEAEWEFARPGTVSEAVGRDVCKYVDKLQEAAKKDTAQPTGLSGHF